MAHRVRQRRSAAVVALCPAVREGARDADGAEGVEAVRVLHDGQLGEPPQGGEVDGWMLRFGAVGYRGADDGGRDGDVWGPAQGDEVRFYGWGGGRDDGRGLVVLLRGGVGEGRVDGG